MIQAIVLGANGQLGSCLKEVINTSEQTKVDYHFCSSAEADITNEEQISKLIDRIQPQVIVNAAAYTKVDLAEKERDSAFLINACSVQKLAKLCAKRDVVLIHISTDYVFDGTKKEAYLEEDATNPINAYGLSKWEGEKQLRNSHSKHFIIRTSWLYSDKGQNFYNSMLRLFAEKEELTITTDQVGCPTNAYDLAEFIHFLVANQAAHFGTYHFCNTEETTWYAFAKQILEGSKENFTCKVSPIDSYPTPAKRPAHSVMSTQKIQQTFGYKIDNWKDALAKLQAKV